MAFNKVLISVLFVATILTNGGQCRPENHIHHYRYEIDSGNTNQSPLGYDVVQTPTGWVLFPKGYAQGNQGNVVEEATAASTTVKEQPSSQPQSSKAGPCKRGLIGNTANAAKNVINGATNKLQGALSAATGHGKFLGPVGGFVNTLGKGVHSIFTNAVSGANNIINDAACGIGNVANAAAEGIHTGNILGGVGNMADEIVGGVKNIGGAALGAVDNALTDTGKHFKNFFNTLG